MVGREKEIGDLISLLKKPDIGLISLHGFGGTGRIRLAVEAGGAALDLSPDEVWFVTLTSLNSPDHFINITASALGFSFHGSESAQVQLRSFLRGEKLLLIFDTMEGIPAVPISFSGSRSMGPYLRIL